MSHAGRTAPADLGSTPSEGGGAELDQELVALNAPPQTQRVVTVTVMAAAVVAALALVVSLFGDMSYALARTQPRDLGDARQLDLSSLESNSYVHLEGIPTVARAVRFSRGLGTQYRVFPLSGQRQVYVQIEEHGGESFVRSEFSGRLVSFEDLGGRYADLAKSMQEDAGLPVTGESFMLLVDEQPSAYLWTWLVGLFCLGFVLLDAYFIVRWFKPVKWAQEE
ncbi:MAG: hypothetical protein QM778_03975 [Myxococcales bacterium]